ncbi:MAG: MoaD/ThiS family protein [Gemmatimonadaceae bacterium]
MTFDVLLFASYADAFGERSVRVTVPPGALVADVVRVLRGLADAGTIPERPLVAVNHRYAKGEQELRDGDEIALIPPVAGG